jgi:hypothetical protein
VIVGVLAILSSAWAILDLNVLVYFITFFGFVEFILHVLILSELLKIRKAGVKIVKHLKSFLIVFIIATFLSAILASSNDLMSLFHNAERNYDLNFIAHFLKAIPFIYLGIFFFDVRKETKNILHQKH